MCDMVFNSASNALPILIAISVFALFQVGELSKQLQISKLFDSGIISF